MPFSLPHHNHCIYLYKPPHLDSQTLLGKISCPFSIPTSLSQGTALHWRWVKLSAGSMLSWWHGDLTAGFHSNVDGCTIHHTIRWVSGSHSTYLALWRLDILPGFMMETVSETARWLHPGPCAKLFVPLWVTLCKLWAHLHTLFMESPPPWPSLVHFCLIQ